MNRQSPTRGVFAALAWTALLSLTALAATVAPAQCQTVATRTIDVNAVVRVTVAGEADVSGDYTVDPNGDISLLYVNQVHVGGDTVAEAAATLRRALAKFYVRPQVVVAILQPGGITVTLSGEVTTPKDYTVRSDAHLSDLLPGAGPLQDADLTRIQITHGGPDTPDHTQQTVNYLVFRDSSDPTGNPLLHQGDVVYVPSHTPVPIVVTFSGDFAKPGLQSVPAGTTAYNAILLNGGLTASADPKGLVIERGTATIPFNYYAASQNPADPQADPALLQGDILVTGVQPAKNNFFTITGAVGRPGPVTLTRPSMTLAEALGEAGGTTANARIKQVTIVRTGTDGKTQTIHLDAHDPEVQGTTYLYPGDNVNIPQGTPGFRPGLGDLFGVLSGLGTALYIFGR